LAYPSAPGHLGWLVFIGLIPLFWSIKQPSFWKGFAAGAVYFAIVLRWFWFAYPLEGFGIVNHWLAGLLILLFYSISVAVLAAGWGIVTSTIFNSQFSNLKSNKAIVSNLAVAGVFTLVEYLRAAVEILLYGF